MSRKSGINVGKRKTSSIGIMRHTNIYEVFYIRTIYIEVVKDIWSMHFSKNVFFVKTHKTLILFICVYLAYIRKIWIISFTKGSIRNKSIISTAVFRNLYDLFVFVCTFHPLTLGKNFTLTYSEWSIKALIL